MRTEVAGIKALVVASVSRKRRKNQCGGSFCGVAEIKVLSVAPAIISFKSRTGTSKIRGLSLATAIYLPRMRFLFVVPCFCLWLPQIPGGCKKVCVNGH